MISSVSEVQAVRFVISVLEFSDQEPVCPLLLADAYSRMTKAFTHPTKSLPLFYRLGLKHAVNVYIYLLDPKIYN